MFNEGEEEEEEEEGYYRFGGGYCSFFFLSQKYIPTKNVSDIRDVPSADC